MLFTLSRELYHNQEGDSSLPLREKLRFQIQTWLIAEFVIAKHCRAPNLFQSLDVYILLFVDKIQIVSMRLQIDVYDFYFTTEFNQFRLVSQSRK